MATERYLFMRNEALYLVETLEWCVYALFSSDWQWINKHRLVDSMIQHANLAVNLEGYLWAVSSLITENSNKIPGRDVYWTNYTTSY